MKGYKSCMVTGHRKIALDKTEYISQELRREIIEAIKDAYIHFISGFAEGVNLLFADIVVELKANYPIKLEAAIPYRNRINTKDANFQRLISKCDMIGIHSDKYAPSCFMKRNLFMAQNSERVIVVYDGRQKSYTLATMRYANLLEKDVRVIYIKLDLSGAF